MKTNFHCRGPYHGSSYPSVRIRFLTSTPLDIRQGSGTYVGMHVLARALAALGHTVEFETPRVPLPVYHGAAPAVQSTAARPTATSISPSASIWTATASPRARAHVRRSKA